ncbi:hypothetical protein C8A01DRAFT_51608 [Parachaetomium inaequale]|uniref:Uncharacterized protein n=1 Tax=Parachaetomium inaequale TaxID=2588326 RepID=A0AAN6P3T7_9PEZI|nr:hypothetical protein C8A01DRAFT_51608 [Parachaetomium inaequale]
MDVPMAANILALIPQIVVNYRRHNATGLQAVLLGVYNIVLVLTFLSLNITILRALLIIVLNLLTILIILIAALSATLLAAGIIQGISFIFVGIDAAGVLFSLASIFFQSRLDLVLWCGVFACGSYLTFLTLARLRTGVTMDRGSDEERHPVQEAAGLHTSII